MNSRPTDATIDEVTKAQIEPKSPGTPQISRRRARALQIFHSTLWMVLIGLAIRLVVMGFLYPEQLDPERDHWRFSYENGRLARSIAEGKGFSGPLFEDTGV